MTTAIVKLDPLTDTIRTAPQDHNFFLVRWPRLALHIAKGRGLIRRIHIGCLRLKLGSTRVDSLEHSVHTDAKACPAHIRLTKPGQRRQSSIGKAHHFQGPQTLCVFWQATAAHLGFGLNNLADTGQKPWVEHCDAMDVFIAQSMPHSLCNRAHSVRCLLADCPNNSCSVGRTLNLNLVKSGQPRLHRCQRLL